MASTLNGKAKNLDQCGAAGGEGLTKGGLGGGAVGDAETDATDIALVEDVRQGHFEDDREAETRRRLRRFARGVR